MRQAVAVPNTEGHATKSNLSCLVGQCSGFERNPSQRILGRFAIRYPPIEPRFLELLAACGVFLADLLRGCTSNANTLALREPIGQFLQIESTEEFVLLTNGPGTGFVAKIPSRVHLSRHRAKHAGVLVLYAYLEGSENGWHLLLLYPVPTIKSSKSPMCSLRCTRS